jgi:SAM-dependent methyltransferase
LTALPHLVAATACRVCGTPAAKIGCVRGNFTQRDFELRRCDACGFAFIADPWTDFPAIYDERYYAGRGADPLVDYRFELEHPQRSVRRYEWRGVTRLVSGLRGGLDRARWLDFGCGNGGLVRYVRDHSTASAWGFEEGSIADDARRLGIPILSEAELADRGGEFDVVTAIEVLEHTIDPVSELRRIRKLLRPGGLLFLTTGNAAPYRDRLLRWTYVVPEIHVSFFEPATLDYALREAGFAPARIAREQGYNDILKFKVLKNMRIRRRSRLTDALPAGLIAAAADRRVRLTEHPVGWAT